MKTPTAAANSEGEFNCRDGGRLKYSTAGVGDPVVLLHGFGLDSGMWEPQWPVFSEHYRLVRYDLRGYGASSLPSGPYSHVDDFVALTDFLEVSPAHLVGLSLGGRIALRIASQVPGAVRSLTLVDSALDGHVWSREWSERWRAMITAANTDATLAKRLWLEHELFDPARARPAAAQALDTMVRGYSGWHFHSDDPGAGPLRSIFELLPSILAPTLVIVGERDLPDFQAIARRLARQIPRASLRVIPNVGHMPNLEDPFFFNQLVLEHLRTCGV